MIGMLRNVKPAQKHKHVRVTKDSDRLYNHSVPLTRPTKGEKRKATVLSENSETDISLL